MSYTVTAKLISRRTDQANDDDQKVVSLPSTQHRWTIWYESNDNESKCKEDEERHKEELPFSECDLVQYFCDVGEEYFYLQIIIRTQFRRDPDAQSRCNGILGAILLQSETDIEKQRVSNTSERNRKQQSPLQIEYRHQHSSSAQQTGKQHPVEVAKRIHDSFMKHITGKTKNQNQVAKSTVTELWRWIEEHGISALDEKHKIQKEYALLTQSQNHLKNIKNLLQKEMEEKLRHNSWITEKLNEERKHTQELMAVIQDLRESNDADKTKLQNKVSEIRRLKKELEGYHQMKQGRDARDEDNGNFITSGVNDDPQAINVSEDDEQSQGNKKQFAFVHREEAPVESPFTEANSGWGNDYTKTSGGWASFESTNFSLSKETKGHIFKPHLQWEKTKWCNKKFYYQHICVGECRFSFISQDELMFEDRTYTISTQDAFSGGDTNDHHEDNMAECTFKPIVQLEEVNVAAGTEGDIMLDSFEIVKLYRWGKDVMGDAGWRSRASNTTIDIWQQPNKGKVRVICRESATHKLRMNHWLPVSNIANALLRAEKFVQWSGFDTTIHAEDEDDNNGFCMFNCRFRDGEIAKKLYDLLVESIENNEKLIANAEQ